MIRFGEPGSPIKSDFQSYIFEMICFGGRKRETLILAQQMLGSVN